MRATDRRWLAGRCSWVHACVQIRYDTVARPSCRRVRGANSIKQDDGPNSLPGVDSQIGPQFFDRRTRAAWVRLYPSSARRAATTPTIRSRSPRIMSGWPPQLQTPIIAAAVALSRDAMEHGAYELARRLACLRRRNRLDHSKTCVLGPGARRAVQRLALYDGLAGHGEAPWRWTTVTSRTTARKAVRSRSPMSRFEGATRDGKPAGYPFGVTPDEMSRPHPLAPEADKRLASECFTREPHVASNSLPED